MESGSVRKVPVTWWQYLHITETNGQWQLVVLLQLCIVQLLRITATGVNLQIVGIAPVHILLEKHLLVPSVYLSSVV